MILKVRTVKSFPFLKGNTCVPPTSKWGELFFLPSKGILFWGACHGCKYSVKLQGIIGNPIIVCYYAWKGNNNHIDKREKIHENPLCKSVYQICWHCSSSFWWLFMVKYLDLYTDIRFRHQKLLKGKNFNHFSPNCQTQKHIDQIISVPKSAPTTIQIIYLVGVFHIPFNQQRVLEIFPHQFLGLKICWVTPVLSASSKADSTSRDLTHWLMVGNDSPWSQN